MSVKSQASNMRRLSMLLSHDLSFIGGERECGPNGSKKAFLNTGKAFLRALARDLGLHDVTVSANPGGIAVSGECTLIGMWETGGIYVCLYQSAGGGNDVLLYAYVRGARPELVSGVQLSHVKLTTRKQDTVIFYVLETYEVFRSGQQAA